MPMELSFNELQSIHVILCFNCNAEDHSHLFNFLDWEMMAQLQWKGGSVMAILCKG